MNNRQLMWSFGANLNIRSMLHRCPRAVLCKPLIVADAALVFRGVADVEIRKGSFVQGGLWWITEECEEALDRFEGVRHGLYKKMYLPVWKKRISGEWRKALFYKMNDEHGIMPPSAHYAQTIAQGYRDFGLDLEFLDAAIQESWTEKKVTPTLRRRADIKGWPKLSRGGFCPA
jgi:hypothetical protein